MKKCPACGKANSDENMFCTDCGAKLPTAEETKICPGCGREIAADEAFCHFCGTRQPAAGTAAPAETEAPRQEDEGVKIWPASTRGGKGRLADEEVRREAEESRKAAARGSSSRYVEDLDEDYEEAYEDRKSRSSRKESYRDDYDDYDDDDDYEEEGMSLGMKIAIAVLGVAALAAVAAVAFVIFGGPNLLGNKKGAATAPTTAAETTAAPTTEAPATTQAPTEPEVAETAPAQTFGEPQVISATVTASSCLDLAYYNPDYLMDLNADTAWAEAEDGLGEGTELKYQFNGKTWIYGIAVLPGFQRSEDTFNSYSMPSKLTVDTGKVEIPISLANYKPNFSNPSSSCAYFKFSQPVQADQVTVKISEAKAGTTYKDTCITEMFFFYYPSSEAQATNSRPQIRSAGWDSTAPTAAGGDAGTAQQPQSGETSAQQTSSGDYVLPNSSSAYITAEDLAGLSKEQLRLARNEIYARHGYRFNGADLKSYFESKSWYSGTVSPDSFDESVLNEYEIANIGTIRDAENR